MPITEVQGDLFTSSDSLVHCVSRDLHMGKGIATEFKKQFGGVDELRQQSMRVLFYLMHGDWVSAVVWFMRTKFLNTIFAILAVLFIF